MREPGPIITPATYRSLFTFDEKCSIYEAAKTSIPIQIILDDLICVPLIDLTDERVAFGLAYLVNLGLISYSRMQEILSYRE